MQPRRLLRSAVMSLFYDIRVLRFRGLLLDAWDSVSRTERPELVPPRSLQILSGGWRLYREIGDILLGQFVELGGLRPDDAVLDVGCGAGRVARPLVGYLAPDGRYEGFDVVARAVRWCRRNITPRRSDFRFHHADVYNRFYNYRGKIAARDHRFPYDDASFDFVFLASVFTHMLPDGVANYTGEIARVLRPGGRCFATLFLLNAESRRLIRQGRSERALRGGTGVYAVEDERYPEMAIGYDEGWLRERFARHGLQIGDRVHYGSWCGRAEHTGVQDIVVARRPGAGAGER